MHDGTFNDQLVCGVIWGKAPVHIQPLHIANIIWIFMCTKDDLEKCYEWLNQFHITMKLSMEIHAEGVRFWDTLIEILILTCSVDVF